MNGGFLKFLVAVLAVWRLSHLLAREDGPWEIFLRIRRVAGKLFDCFYCLSLWVAIPATLWFRASLVDSVVLWFAISGAACLLDRLSPEPVVIEHLPSAAAETKPNESAEI